MNLPDLRKDGGRELHTGLNILTLVIGLSCSDTRVRRTSVISEQYTEYKRM